MQHGAALRLLVGAGADQEAQDYMGLRPLHVAAQLGSKAAVVALLEATPVLNRDPLLCSPPAP